MIIMQHRSTRPPVVAAIQLVLGTRALSLDELGHELDARGWTPLAADVDTYLAAAYLGALGRMATLLVDSPKARAQVQKITDPLAALGTMAVTDALRRDAA